MLLRLNPSIIKSVPSVNCVCTVVSVISTSYDLCVSVSPSVRILGAPVFFSGTSSTSSSLGSIYSKEIER